MNMRSFYFDSLNYCAGAKFDLQLKWLYKVVYELVPASYIPLYLRLVPRAPEKLNFQPPGGDIALFLWQSQNNLKKAQNLLQGVTDYCF